MPKAFSMKKLTANDVMSSVITLAPRSRRNATRSIATDASVAARIATGTVAYQLMPRLVISHIT